MILRSAPVSRLPAFALSAALALSVVGFATPASAQDEESAPAPPPARQPAPSPGYAQKQATGEYVAPLSQQTQPTYVPQSVALSGPKEISDFDEGAPIPAGYTPVSRARKGMIIAGSIVFGSLYGLSALTAAVDADSGSKELQALWVPGIGPFIQMFSTESATGNLFLAIDGLGQSAAIAMLIYGLTTPKTVLVRNDLAQTKPTVQLAPMTARGTTGLAVVGTF